MHSGAEGGKHRRRGILRWLVCLVYQPAVERERKFYDRLRELSAAVDEAPESLTRRVLRGELYLERGEMARAKADFQAALALSEAMDGAKSWLIVEQVMRDRALRGLRMANAKANADS